MPDQSQPEKHPVVGEDGELLEPDTTVDPNAYTKFLATYIHRDPLLFRIRENIHDNGCLYLFLTLAFGCMACGFINIALTSRENILSLIIMLILVVGGAAVFGYMVLQTDTRQ